MELTSSSNRLHALKCELGHLLQADGSASFAQGKSVVWVSVFGPCDLKGNRHKAHRALVEMNLKPKVTSVDFEIK